MKKKLLMGTVLALTLGVSSCGMFGGGDDTSSSSASSSSSVSSSTTQSSSSTFANLTSLNIAAPTNLLTQTVGSLSKVAFAATTNAGANPSVVEWFVNDVKTTVKGLNFEFTPNAAGNFKVEAKSGNVVSNSLTIVAGGSAVTGFVIESVKAIDADTFEVKAPGGAAVSVTGKTLAATSRYDLARGVYVVDVTSAFAQGATATVSLVKDGVTKTEAFTFDTRTLVVESLKQSSTDIKVGTDGIYEVTKPNALINDASGLANTSTLAYTITFEGTNFVTAAIPFKKEYVVPSGVTAVPAVEGMVTLDNNASSAGTMAFTLSKDTVVGVYEYKYTVDGVSSNVKVRVVSPSAKIDFAQFNSNIDKDSLTGLAPETGYKYDIKYVQTNLVSGTATAGDDVGVAKNANGSYTIVKDYIAKAGFYKTFTFELDAENFGIPTGTLDVSNPNQVSITVAGPNNTPLMVSNLNGTSNVLPTSFAFRSFFDGSASNKMLVSQTVDASTPKGIYTYTVKVLQLGIQIFSKDIVVEVKDPVANLDLTVVNTGDTSLSFKKIDDLTFEVQKPRGTGLDAHPLAVSLKVNNYESPLDTSFVGANYFQGVGLSAGTPAKTLLDYKVTSSGPTTLSGINVQSKVALEVGVTNNGKVAYNASTAGHTDAKLTVTNPGFVIANSATTPVLYSYYGAAEASELNLGNIFTFTVDYLTSPGTYNFEVKVGALTKVLTVRVLAPVQNTNFTISTASGSGVEFNKVDNKYYTTLGNNSSKTVNFGLVLENMELDANSKVNYTLAVTTPNAASSTTNLITAANIATTGNLSSAAILNLLGDTAISNSLKPVTFTEAGEYKYDLSVNGVKKVVTLVVLDFPRLTVDSVSVGTTQLSKFTFATVEQYLVNSTTATSLKLSVKGLNLPAKVYFSVAAETDKVTATAVSTSTLVTFKDGVAEIPVTIVVPTTVVAAASPVVAGDNAFYTITVGLHTYDGTTFTSINSSALVVRVRANPKF
jgi:hypothetical protein